MIGEEGVLLCHPEKPELGHVWLSVTQPLINNTPLSSYIVGPLGSAAGGGPKASALDLQALLGCDSCTLSIPTGGLSEQRWVCAHGALLKINEPNVLPLFQCNSAWLHAVIPLRLR